MSCEGSVPFWVRLGEISDLIPDSAEQILRECLSRLHLPRTRISADRDSVVNRIPSTVLLQNWFAADWHLTLLGNVLHCGD
jgi:hypothetical protein